VAVDEFDAVFDVNVRAPYFFVADLAPRMAGHGAGAIINISTMVANYGQAGMSLYGASKAAIQLLTKTWAAEFGPAGVRVNAVSPGPTATEGTTSMQGLLNQMAVALPSRRVGTPTDVANAIVFLASRRRRPHRHLKPDRFTFAVRTAARHGPKTATSQRNGGSPIFRHYPSLWRHIQSVRDAETPFGRFRHVTAIPEVAHAFSSVGVR
jgi:NAD(P)-dependent dehydrogenase (short-subunit alcohol dehydrogenase family)